MKSTYCNLKNIVHNLQWHRVYEALKNRYSYVDEFVSCIKKTLKQAPARIQKYVETTGLPLLLSLILTKLGTWLKVAVFIWNNLPAIAVSYMIRQISSHISNSTSFSTLLSLSYLIFAPKIPRYTENLWGYCMDRFHLSIRSDHDTTPIPTIQLQEILRIASLIVFVSLSAILGSLVFEFSILWYIYNKLNGFIHSFHRKIFR